MIEIDDLFEMITSFVTEFTDFFTDVLDPDVGLLSGVDCKFLRLSSRRFYDAICVKFLPPLWKLFLLIAIMSTAMFFGSCFGYCAAMRYSKFN